jgi:Flp pilus assembly protein TadG
MQNQNPARCSNQTTLLGGRFFAHEGGTVASMFALTILVVFGLVGGAIDFARLYRSKAAFQGALDAASLAAARAKQLGSSDTDAIATAESYIAPVKQKFAMDGSIEFKVADEGTTVMATAKLNQPTVFLKIIGMDKLAFTVAGTASFGATSAKKSNVELVMMLDVTGSMSGQKIEDLKSAAQDLIDIVVADNQSNSTSRVGLVPFSHTVKLDNKTFEAATGKKFTGANKGCVVERTGTDAYTDAAPAAGSYVVPLEDKSAGSACDEGREIFPLTDKKSDLKKMIRSLTDGGSTAGHLGTAWAWYLLSPNWGSAFDYSNRPAPYSDLTETLPAGGPKLKKIAVLMTDGGYNTQYSAIDSTTQARELCTNMKSAGITVYTVGFQLNGDATALATLQGCATSSSHFYEASTGDALKLAFRDIALKATPLRLTQ